MGEGGKWTRILGLAHGAFLTYGSFEEGDETAPGQLTVTDLIKTYRVKELDENTEVYGVIGNPVTRSLSPNIHNPAFASVGLNSVFIPLMVKDLDAFMHRMVRRETREIELNFRGFAVTMPHKQAIMQHLDEIDPTAAAIGAVNTVKLDVNGRSIGYNTDAYGFIEPLKQRLRDLSNKRVAVMGAGGASRACIYGLKGEGCDLTVFARDGDKAATLAYELGVSSSTLTEWQNNNFDIVVNATPVGMRGVNADNSLLNAAQLKGVRFVYDLVTSPTDTPFIREARAAGIEAIGGLEMLIAQAAKQFEIWTGQPANVELMRTSAMEHLK
jgi:3-dehydroquinate dehydratase/shikimate dehydrogenase